MIDDEPSDSTTIIKKILGAKLFDDESGTWKRDVRDIEGEVLCGQSPPPAQVKARTHIIVSQFTLLATLQGTKPGTYLHRTCEGGDG
jgi:D-tyrosyl-tRNA(Tyr) deacylase